MGRKRGNRSTTNFDESYQLNKQAYNHYYKRLKELAVSMFDWVNLPDSIDRRFLEMTLYEKGQIVIFKDEDLGILALPVTTAGGFDLYNRPKRRMAYASNGYRRELNETNSVIIYNNYLRTNSVNDVEMFAWRLASKVRAIDVNVNAQKTPILITCDEDQRLTLENVYKQYSGNEPVIYGNTGLTKSNISVLATGAPFVADKIRTELTADWNEALTCLGISNINVTKKERLISDEVVRSQGGTIASRYSRLDMRRMGCEEAVRMFPELEGLTCEYREDYREVDDEYVLTGDTGDRSADLLATDLRTRGGRIEL